TPESGNDAIALRVDENRVRQYLKLLHSLKDELGLPGQVDLSLLSRFTDLVIDDTEIEERVPDVGSVQQVTEAAARAVIAMREDEGLRLRADLEERLNSIETTMARIAELAPAR